MHKSKQKKRHNTVLSRSVGSLFEPTRKPSLWSNFSDGGSFVVGPFGWLIHWLKISWLWFWLVYWTRTARRVFTGAGLKWPNTMGQNRTLKSRLSFIKSIRRKKANTFYKKGIQKNKFIQYLKKYLKSVESMIGVEQKINTSKIGRKREENHPGQKNKKSALVLLGNFRRWRLQLPVFLIRGNLFLLLFLVSFREIQAVFQNPRDNVLRGQWIAAVDHLEFSPTLRLGVRVGPVNVLEDRRDPVHHYVHFEMIQQLSTAVKQKQNEYISQSSKCEINQSINRSTDRAYFQSINQSSDQSIDQSINRKIANIEELIYLTA